MNKLSSESKSIQSRNVALIITLMFLAGAPLGLSTLVNPIKQSDYFALAPTFLAGLGVRTFSAAMAIIITSLTLQYASPSALRISIFCSALFHGSLFYLPYALQQNSHELVTLVLTLFGIANGSVFVSGTAAAGKWMPQAPGLAMAISFGAMGVGGAITSILLGSIVQNCHPKVCNPHSQAQALEDTINGFAIILVFANLFVWLRFSLPSFTLILSEPVVSSTPTESDSLVPKEDDKQKNQMHQHMETKTLGIRLFLYKEFYMFLVIGLVGIGPTFGYFIAVPSLIDDYFQYSSEQIAPLFALINIVLMVARFLGGVLVDYTNFSGFFWSGAKNCCAVCLFFQMIACFYLPFSIKYHSFEGFFIASVTLAWSHAFIASVTAVLATHMFSANNNLLVWGLGKGLSGFVSLWTVAALSKIEPKVILDTISGKEIITPPPIPWLFSMVFFAATLIGFICCLTLNRCEAAFMIDTPDGPHMVVEAGARVSYQDNQEESFPDLDASAFHSIHSTSHGSLEALPKKNCSGNGELSTWAGIKMPDYEYVMSPSDPGHRDLPDPIALAMHEPPPPEPNWGFPGK